MPSASPHSPATLARAVIGYPLSPWQRKNQPPDPPQPDSSDELSAAAQVTAWRSLMLLDLGFSMDQVQKLATRLDFDWHEAERLRRLGCSPEVAFDILI